MFVWLVTNMDLLCVEKGWGGIWRQFANISHARFYWLELKKGAGVNVKPVRKFAHFHLVDSKKNRIKRGSNHAFYVWQRAGVTNCWKWIFEHRLWNYSELKSPEKITAQTFRKFLPTPSPLILSIQINVSADPWVKYKLNNVIYHLACLYFSSQKNKL